MMEFAAFFQALAYGAIAIVAAVLAWTVQMVLKLTTAVNTLEANVASLQRDSSSCSTDRHDTSAKVDAVATAVKVLDERLANVAVLLHEVREAVRPPPRARVRKAAP